MAMEYRLIVSDFDGTLRRSTGEISDENVCAINAYMESGGIFALCTGRMPSSILPYARQLKLQGLLAVYQGAVIQDIVSGEIVRDCRIPPENAQEICSFLQEFDAHIHVYDGDQLYVNKDDIFRAWYESICRVRGILTPFTISETVESKKISPHKIILVCESKDRAKMLDVVGARFGSRFYVTTSAENLVEIVMRGCDKGGALEYLSDYYRIPLSQTIALGDNYNDLPMIRKAGLGVAVENAEKILKENAKFVTKSCDEDGVAYVIRKFGLGENL